MLRLIKPPLTIASSRTVWSNAHMIYRDDPLINEKKQQKTKDHFMVIKRDNLGGQISPDEAEFYAKLDITPNSTGYRSLNMRRQIAKVERYYMTKREWTKEEIEQQIREYHIEMQHLLNSLAIDDQQTALKFLELNHHSEEAEAAVIEYYVPSMLADYNKDRELGQIHSIPAIKNPKTRMTKFQLEQALNIGKTDEIMQMTKVYSYGDVKHLSSRDFIFDIQQRIEELDQKLEEYHKNRFDSQEISQEFEKLVDQGIEYRDHLLSSGWKSSKEFETVAGINNMSEEMYRLAVNEMDRLVDHPLYYSEIEFLIPYTASREEDRYSFPDRPEFGVKKELVKNYQLQTGETLPEAEIYTVQGLFSSFDTAVCDLKMIKQVINNSNKSQKPIDPTIRINGYSLLYYFPYLADRLYALAPISLLNKMGEYHLEAKIYGGDNFNEKSEAGYHTFQQNSDRLRRKQAAAMNNGIARVLYQLGDNDQRKALSLVGMCEPDPRRELPAHPAREGHPRKNRQWRRR